MPAIRRRPFSPAVLCAVRVPCVRITVSAAEYLLSTIPSAAARTRWHHATSLPHIGWRPSMHRISVALVLGLCRSSTAGLNEAVGSIRSSSTLFVPAGDRAHPLAMSSVGHAQAFTTNKIARSTERPHMRDTVEPGDTGPTEGGYL